MILHFYVIRFQNEVSYTIIHHNIAEKNALKRMKVEFDTVTFGFTKFFKCFEQKIMWNMLLKVNGKYKVNHWHKK